MAKNKKANLLFISIAIFSLIFGGCTANPSGTPQSNNVNTTSDNSAQTPAIKPVSQGYETLIHEILETDNYQNKYVEIKGRVELIPDTYYDGLIVDEKGYKLLFKLSQRRGFNEAKTYLFKGEVVYTNQVKNLYVPTFVTEVSQT